MNYIRPTANNVVRFSNELFASCMMRARRLGGRPMYWHHFNDMDSRSSASVFHTYVPRFPDDPIQAEQLLAEIDDATSWGLISLIRNWDIPILSLLGAAQLELSENRKTLRFCRDCALQQRRDFGTSWWRRDEQLPHVAVCPEHSAPLYSIGSYVLLDTGRMPHEVSAAAKVLDVKVTDDARCQARAMILLSHFASQIESDIFKENLMQRCNVVSDLDGYVTQKLLPTRCCVSECHALRRSSFRRKTNDPHPMGLSKNGDCEWALACFAALTSDPEYDVERMVQKSKCSIHIPADIDEQAVNKYIYSVERIARKFGVTPRNV